MKRVWNKKKRVFYGLKRDWHGLNRKWDNMMPFFHAVSFLTRIPVSAVVTDEKSSDFQMRSVGFYPIVGLFIGVLLWLFATVMIYVFPFSVSAALLLAFWIYITGGLHLDGWMDLADGLGSRREKEKVLEIMEDSRVGAMGVIAGTMLILVKWAAVYQLLTSGMLLWLFFPSFVARLVLIEVIRKVPYVRKNGLGTDLKHGISRRMIYIYLFLITILVIGVQGIFSGTFFLGLTFISAWWFVRWVTRRLNGFTGDGYGALVEWLEATGLLAILIVERFFA